MSFPRGRAHRILPSSTRTQATVSIRTGVIRGQAAWSACSCRTTFTASPTCWPMLVMELKTCRTVPWRSITYVTRPGSRPGPVELAAQAALIGQERERQLVLSGEGRVLVGRVGADPDLLGAGVGEDLVTVTEGTGLGGAAAGVVLGVEVQHDDPLAEPVPEPPRLPPLRREGEVGGLVADLDTVCHAASLPGSPLTAGCTPSVAALR